MNPASETSMHFERNPARNGFYAFALVSLLVFAGGLYLWPTPIRGYLAECALEVHGERFGEDNDLPLSRSQAAALRELARSIDLVRQALERIGPPPGVQREAGVAFPTAAEVEFVRRGVLVEVEMQDTLAPARCVFHYTGLDADWSAVLVEELARLTVAALEQKAAEQVAAALAARGDSALQRAERRERAAREALDSFLSRHFDALSHSGGLVSRGVEDGGQPPAPPLPRVNPAWQSLRERIASESARLDQILLDRLPEHPQAKEAALRLEGLKQQLERTPRFLLDEAAARVRRRYEAQQAQFAEFVAGQAEFGHDPFASAGVEYERLVAELDRAREALQAAERAAASGQSESAQAALPAVRGTIIANARLVQTLREGVSASRLTVLALVAVFAGACLAIMFRTDRRVSVYTVAAEVERDLKLPVVGVVPVPARGSAAALPR